MIEPNEYARKASERIADEFSMDIIEDDPEVLEIITQAIDAATADIQSQLAGVTKERDALLNKQ